MGWAMTTGLRNRLTRIAFASALIGLAAAGATVSANEASGVAGIGGAPVPLQTPTTTPTAPNDPRCKQQPGAAPCYPKGTYNFPSSPSDPSCATMPNDPVCAGGPYAPPTPPPP